MLLSVWVLKHIYFDHLFVAYKFNPLFIVLNGLEDCDSFLPIRVDMEMEIRVRSHSILEEELIYLG